MWKKVSGGGLLTQWIVIYLVEFYNWLKERDGLPQSIVHVEPSLGNWLEW
ncbi:hypothetical protein [Lysinibacillus parviboronicapiens]|nr:hypothetical protein [Lysinibacillus parviboronicapiens]